MLPAVTLDDNNWCFNNYNQVIDYVRLIHADQRDKGGNPYIQHLEYVGCLQLTFVGMVVGLLHDSIEDGKTTRKELEDRGFPESVIARVELLDRRNNTSSNYLQDGTAQAQYEAYIRRLSEDPITRSVKIIDLEHNMQIYRLPSFDQSHLKRLQKYHSAHRILKEIEAAAERVAEEQAGV